MNGEKLHGQELKDAGGGAGDVEEKAKKVEAEAVASGEWEDFLKEVTEDAGKQEVLESMRKGLDPIVGENVKSYADLVMMEGTKMKSASAMMTDIYEAMVARMPELGKEEYRDKMAEKIRRAMMKEIQSRLDDLETSAARAEAQGQVAKNEEAMVKLMEALEDVKGAYPEELAA